MQHSDVSDFAGLAEWVAAVLESTRGVPQRATVHANADAVMAIVSWVEVKSVREAWSTCLGVPRSPEFRVLEAHVAPVDGTPVRKTTAGVVDFLRRQLGPGVVSRETVDRFRVVDFQRMNAASQSIQRGSESFGKSIEAKIANVDQLPEFVDVSIELCPLLPGVLGSFRVMIDAKPAEEVFAVWVLERDVVNAKTQLAAAVRAKAQGIFDALQVMAEGSETANRVSVISGLGRSEFVSEWDRSRESMPGVVPARR